MGEIIQIKVVKLNKLKTTQIPVDEIDTKVVCSNVTVSAGVASDYNKLKNKPEINNNVLTGGNNTLEYLGIVNDKNFVFTQSSASDTWVITHNLNKFPSVAVVDSGGTVVYGEIEYVDVNQIILTFSAPFSGMAYLN